MKSLIRKIYKFISLVVFMVILTTDAAYGQNILEMDAMVVEGRIQRPQASYILQRANLDFGITAKKKSFVNEIVKTIEKEPF